MQLPQDLQHFPTSTLLIVSDSIAAKFWLLGGDEMEEIDSVSLPRERKQDSEGSYVSSDGSRTGAPNQADDTERLHQFVHLVVDRTARLTREHGITRIHLVMPVDMERTISQHLPSDVSTKLTKPVHADLMKDDMLDVVRRVLNA